MRCEKCDREFTEEGGPKHPGKTYKYKGKVHCEDCLIDMGVSIEGVGEMPWTYITTRADLERQSTTVSDSSDLYRIIEQTVYFTIVISHHQST